MNNLPRQFRFPGWYWRTLLWVYVWFVFGIILANYAHAQSGVDIVRNDAAGLQVRIVTDPQNAEVALAKTAIAGTDSDYSAPATPLLTQTLLLVLPTTGEPRLQVNPATMVDFTPAPTLARPPVGQQFCRLVDTGYWRGFRLARLEIAPLVRGDEGKLLLATRLELSLQYPATSLGPAPSPLLPEETKMLRAVINRQMAPRWRQREHPTVQPRFSAFAGKTEVKIEIRDSGFYRLTPAALQIAGLSVADIDPRRVQLWQSGRQLPLFFSGDTDSLFGADESFWFFGERLASDNTWYDDETDRNVYWLKMGATAGLRFDEHIVADAPSAPTPKRFLSHLHFEEDKIYYSGDNDADIFTTGLVPGEGWIWQRLLAGETFSQNLVLPNVVTQAPACSLTVRLRGITRDPVKPNHHAQIFFNDVLIADSYLTDNEDQIIRAGFSADVLKNGNNALKIVSVGDTGAQIDQFYLDWVEIAYWHEYTAAGNTLAFAPQIDREDPFVRYQITNLHEPTIFLFDLAQSRRLSGFTTTPIGADQYGISFGDSTAGTHRYQVLTPAALDAPLALTAVTPTDWHSPANGADFIVISHADFMAEARRLAEYRTQKNGWRSVVVNIEDIFNEFGAGFPRAQALQDFLAHAYRTWQLPAPRYVALFGDGSWDPKKNAGTSKKGNFIPVFGNPVSDNRFVCFDGADDFLPDMFIGRLAVETAEQASAVVDKIIAYESQPLQRWGKDFIFLNGGIDRYEQALFLSQSESLIERFVQAPPISGRPVRVYKQTEGRFAGELLPEIFAAIDSGAQMLAFSGHAGSQTWELMMVNEDIARLQNENRLPFIASMTCHTARFGNPDQTSFGEDFLRAPRGGAVAFWGTSGWGFIFQDGVLLEGLYQAIARDSVRAVGAGAAAAKLHLWQQYGTYSTNISVIDQYTLLGDPALQLSLPLQPDLTITPGEISFSPQTPAETDSVLQVQVVVHNHGLQCIDSTQIVLQTAATGSGETGFVAERRLGAIGYSDSVRFAWPGKNRRGAYVVTAAVDADDLVAEVDDNNNDARQEVYFYSASLALATPRDLDVLSEIQPILSIYNPEIAAASPRGYFFEIDTTARFDSPQKLASGTVAEQPVRTGWRVPVALPDGVYFWRSRSASAGTFGPWQRSEFFIDTKMSGTFGLRQDGQFWPKSSGEFSVRDGTAVLPGDPTRQLQLQVQSGGFYDLSRCYLIVNGEIVNQGARGHNLLAIEPASQQWVSPPVGFDTYASAAAADSMAAFLERLPTGTIVMVGIRDDGSVNMTERACRALEMYGSQFCRAVQLRDSWAMIGAKGLAIGAAAEQHRTAQSGQAVVSDTLAPFSVQGTIFSPVIGPATAWGNLYWQSGAGQRLLPGAGPPGTAINVAVQGRRRADDTWQTLLADAAENAEVLQRIDASDFPYLRLRAELRDDDGLDSPALSRWQIDYQPAGDLVLNAGFVHIEQDSLLPGETFTLRATVYYFGEQPLDSVVARLSRPRRNGQNGRYPVASQALRLDANSTAEVALQWIGETPGAHSLFVEVDPDDRIPELYESNNQVVVTAHVCPDTTPPALRITFDGAEVADGDFVASAPEIVCEIADDSPLAIRDSTNVEVFVDDHRIAYGDVATGLRLQLAATTGKNALVSLHPQLSAGEHSVSFLVIDNFGQRVAKTILVEVTMNLQLREVMNYPNPFDRETDFTFVLTQPVETVEIRIYTVAGRLIQKLQLDAPQVGFNHLHWDGRDAEGDALANGVYLYKIIGRSGDRRVEHIEKLVIAR